MATTDEPTRQLTCQEVVDLVTDFLEGALPVRERVRFEHHLVWCPPCVVYVEQIRETIRVAGAAREEELDPDLREGLLSAFRDWRRG